MIKAKKKRPSTDALQKAADEVLRLAKKAGVKVALCGGQALRAYGSPRMTDDLDFVADGVLPGFTKKLSFGGRKGVVKGVEVDLIVRNDDYQALYEAALVDTDDQDIIARPWLVAMKMVANRGKDLLDIEWAVTDDPYCVKPARAIIREHLGIWAADEFDNIVRLAKWKKDNDR